MLSIEELLSYGINGTISVKDYEYTTSEEIVVSMNGKPVNLISVYNDDIGRPTLILYKECNINTKSKADIIIRKKVYKYYGPNDCIRECNDYRNGELYYTECIDCGRENVVETIVHDLKNESIHTIIDCFSKDIHIKKIRSDDKNNNYCVKKFIDGSSYYIETSCYKIGDNNIYQYIKVWKDKYDNPTRVIHKLYNDDFILINKMETNNLEEISCIEWLGKTEILVEETEIGKDIISKTYQDKITKNIHTIYSIPGPSVICEQFFFDKEMLLSMRIDMGEYEYDIEYDINHHVYPGSGVYIVGFRKLNEKSDIEKSVVMMVKSERIIELVSKIFDEMVKDTNDFL